MIQGGNKTPRRRWGIQTHVGCGSYVRPQRCPLALASTRRCTHWVSVATCSAVPIWCTSSRGVVDVWPIGNVARGTLYPLRRRASVGGASRYAPAFLWRGRLSRSRGAPLCKVPTGYRRISNRMAGRHRTASHSTRVRHLHYSTQSERAARVRVSLQYVAAVHSHGLS